MFYVRNKKRKRILEFWAAINIKLKNPLFKKSESHHVAYEL